MYALRRLLFGTPSRRLAVFLLSTALFYGAAAVIQHYIDEVASDPGVSFVLLVVWMSLGVICALLTVIAGGNRLLHAGWMDIFLRDEMEALDARIDGREEEPDDEEHDELMAFKATGDATLRFGVYFLAIAAAHILLSNRIGEDFLNRYQHPGVALVHMRHATPTMRRRGLSMLASKLDFQVTPAVEKVVLKAMDDVDEGVAARAAFVVGTLAMDAGVPRLARMVREQPALRFAALIALAQMRTPAARDAVLEAARSSPKDEPRALAIALGMLRAPAIAPLKAILTESKDEEVRAAAVWALGRLGDRRLLETVAPHLQDDALLVRCAAAHALEGLVVFESSPSLRDAFARTKDPLEMCPERTLPVQEGGPKIVMLPYRNHQLAILRALATTDDPTLLRWYVDNQEGVAYQTALFMKAAWEDLGRKDKDGKLRHHKARLRLQRKQAAKTPAPDAGAP